MQVCGEILQLQQHNGFNIVVDTTKMVITTTTVIAEIIQAIQHNVMHQYFQHLVLVQNHNEKHHVILQLFTFHVFDDLAAVFNEI